jgi:hypothetical protein
MQDEINPRDRMQAILVIVATIAVIVFNALAAMGYVNGITPAQISAKYPTPLTPAGYAFSIWSLIYLGLLMFSIHQMLPRHLQRYRPLRSLYIFSCLLNCGWIFFWHREQIALCAAIILLLAATLWLIRYKLRPYNTTGDTWLAKAPFGIYAGWVTAASMVNIFVLVTYLNVSISSYSANLLAITLVALATAAAVIARVVLRDFLFPLAVAWAFTAIAVKQGGNTAIIVAGAVGVVVCLITAGSIVTQLRDSTSE